MAGETVRIMALATSCFHGSCCPIPLAFHRFLGPKYFFTSGIRQASSSHLFGGLRLRHSSTNPMSQRGKVIPPSSPWLPMPPSSRSALLNSSLPGILGPVPLHLQRRPTPLPKPPRFLKPAPLSTVHGLMFNSGIWSVLVQLGTLLFGVPSLWRFRMLCAPPVAPCSVRTWMLRSASVRPWDCTLATPPEAWPRRLPRCIIPPDLPHPLPFLSWTSASRVVNPGTSNSPAETLRSASGSFASVTPTEPARSIALPPPPTSTIASIPPSSPGELHHTASPQPPRSSMVAASPQGPHLKAFLPFSTDMVKVSSYLGRATFLESFGRPVKVDDVASTLAYKAKVLGSWNTKKLAIENQFFVSCPSSEVVQTLMALRHICGDGFTLQVNHWDQVNGRTPHSLRSKVCISLFNLPLIYWNSDVMAKIVAGFGVSLRASRSSTHCDDLTSFDLYLHYEDLAAIPESVDVTVGSCTHNIKVTVNYSSPLESDSLDPSSSLPS